MTKMNPQDLNAFHHDLHSAKLIPSMALIIRQHLFMSLTYHPVRPTVTSYFL